MNEEIEYAEMLEIPVSTVNVVKKTSRRRKVKNADALLPASKPKTAALNANDSTITPTSLKDTVIAQVNDDLQSVEPTNETSITADAQLFAEGANSEGHIDFDPVPDRIDTVRLYSSDEDREFWRNGFNIPENDYDFEEEYQKEGGRYALNAEKPASKALRIALGAEFAVCCALCGAIFFTNVFMPNSAINTFFRTLQNGSTAAAAIDNRSYSDFTLSGVVSEFSDAELNVSPTGILSFTDACCVYPAADGTVAEVSQEADGTYRIKIAHSSTFTGVIGGLDQVYYAVGDEVKSNVPVGYSAGETEVQVTMYSGGELLNCFEVTEENCLAWVSEE
ncbi:MAG: M23 family metallopeptidase [Clostridiales bacterium]|nr:M23 family metallopeptidase [Clostridiales bacterium]